MPLFSDRRAICQIYFVSIYSVHLENPIDYRTFSGKEIILDIKILLNDDSIINFEMQLGFSPSRLWWINRSLLYLCRCFDNLKNGNDYDLTLPTTQVSIVPEDLFPNEPPEFYAHYMMLNTKPHSPYTSKFKLNVLYLNHINLATEEDAKNGLVVWAEFFRIDTWEQLRELVMEHSNFKEVAEMMHDVNADVSARSIAEAHDKYLHDLASLKACMERAAKERQETQKELDEAQKELDQVQKELDQTQKENDRLLKIIADAGLSPDGK